ncbi:MAG TPA: Crp/Fnr family transcriptional regulator [Chitinophagaceae bacterium]|nr:Crp/Fnr family transcriptional regulator [Chitinophagaceae bacterium]
MNIVQFIRTTLNFSENEMDKILPYFISKNLKKGKHLLKAKQVCNQYYFVQCGTLRIYYYHNNQQITHWFAFENSFFTELESYNTELPTTFYIEAVENVELLLIDKKDMQLLLENHPFWQSFIRKNIEQAFIKLSNIIRAFQTKTGNSLYDLVANNDKMIQKAKLKDLSTMIGITPSSLSRIRKNKIK